MSSAVKVALSNGCPAKNRMPASLLAFLFTLVCAARALADVTSVSITSPTAGGPASVNAGASFPVVISYTANDSGSANVDVVLTLMSGSTVVGSATASITKQFPDPQLRI